MIILSRVVTSAHNVGSESGGDVAIPEDLLEVRNLLATRAQEWKRQLIAEGEARGEANMLLRLLGKRFSLTSEVEDRVRRADIAQLDLWCERFVGEKSLNDVFGDVTH